MLQAFAEVEEALLTRGEQMERREKADRRQAARQISLENHEKLRAAAEELKGELRRYPGLFDIGDSFLPGKKELQLKLKPTTRVLGLTLNDLTQQVRHAF